MAWVCPACSGENGDGMRFCGHCGGARDAAAPGAAERPPLQEERRLVTALFADISGFSELTNRLDPEALLEVIDPAVAALSDVVGRYGGAIEKFAGDALMALFGAPVAHDDDAARALNVALDMHGELARLVPTLPPDAAGLRLHVGVNSGHGIGRVIGSTARFDYAVLGDVVVLAQRLEAAAPVGETYVGETTYRLTRKDFDFESLGELSVKGKDRPVRAWRLLGPRTRHPVPSASAGGRALAGRDRELTMLAGFASRLDEGRGGAAFVVGEAGVGKTALCEALRGRAATAGWEWMEARCPSYGSTLAYGPVAELMRRLLGVPEAGGTAAGDTVQARLTALGLEETAPFIAALCGVEGPAATELTPQTFQTRLHESVVAVLRARAALHPVVLHVDDLQWADRATVALLRDVLAAATAVPLLLVAATRGEGMHLAGELGAAIPSSSLRVDLTPLGVDAVRDIAAAILGAPPDAGLVAALAEHTRGNPFFVEEVTRSLVERGALALHAGVWHSAGGPVLEQVPVTVEGVVAARVDALTGAERAALEVLSVVGRRADVWLARAVGADIDAALPGLRAAGLLEPAGDGGSRHAVFHHPITQQVVYSRLLRRRRADLHRRVGEAAETLLGADDASVDLLARHFALGEVPQKAYDYALLAADRAERLFANEQAVAWLRQALEVEERATGSPAQRAALLLRCAWLEEVRGSYAEALSLYSQARALTDSVRAAAGEASTLRKLGEYDRCLETVRAARAGHADMSAEESALLALEEGWVLGLRGDGRRAVVVLRGGLAAVAGQATAVEADLLVILARTEELLAAHAEALEHGSAARTLLEQREDLPRLATALRVLGGIQHDTSGGDDAGMRVARATLEQALAIARRVGNAEEEAAALVNLAQVLDDLGLKEEAITCDRQSVAAFERVGLRAGVACAYCNLAEHLGGAGRWDESLDAAQHGLAVAREIGNVFWTTGALIGIASARMEQGAAAAACAAADEAAALAMAHGQKAREASALRVGADARGRMGDAAGAAPLLARARTLEGPPPRG